MTKKFNFKLQSVLDLIELKEDLLGQDYAKLLKEMMAEKNKLEILKEDYSCNKEKLEEELSCFFDLKKISFFNDYLKFIDEKIKEEKKIIVLMEEVTEIKRKELEKAMEGKNVMDKLKDRKYKEYTRDTLNQEQKAIDEIGTQRFIYRKEGFLNGS
jgi:flagellar FliJ protein